MKKKLIAAAFLACMAGNVMADDAVVPTIHGSAEGTSWVMNIGLQNASDYVAFQMDVTLPAGVSAGSDDSNIALYDRLKGVTGAVDNSTQFVVSKNLIDSKTNTYRIVGYNLANSAVKDNTANNAMFNMGLTSSEAKALSAVGATVSNAIFVKKDGSELTGVQLVAENGSLAATKGLLGDVNKDGKINQSDAVAALNIYLNNPATGLDVNAANINADGKINQTDAVEILNIYLNNK